MKEVIFTVNYCLLPSLPKLNVPHSTLILNAYSALAGRGFTSGQFAVGYTFPLANRCSVDLNK